jgi:molybdate transport system substrate-binding protein
VIVGILSMLASLAACSSRPSTPSLVVLAAASLEPTFTQIGEQFKTENPRTVVHLDLASSSDLATQLTEGASADVFASADTAQMDNVARAGLVAGPPVNFATNTLVIVTAPGNPKHVASFPDLTKPALSVVISPSPAPCGWRRRTSRTAPECISTRSARNRRWSALARSGHFGSGGLRQVLITCDAVGVSPAGGTSS